MYLKDRVPTEDRKYRILDIVSYYLIMYKISVKDIILPANVNNQHLLLSTLIDDLKQ